MAGRRANIERSDGPAVFIPGCESCAGRLLFRRRKITISQAVSVLEFDVGDLVGAVFDFNAAAEVVWL